MTAPPESPLISHPCLLAALSAPRLGAYSIAADRTSTEAVARYLWNLAIGAALWPAIHLLEVSVRNAIHQVGTEHNGHRLPPSTSVICWLDAGLLEEKEAKEVEKAKERLGPGRRTAGHLVAELTLGFWVRLCNRPYEHGRATGPGLWPRTARLFHHCPRSLRNREHIRRTLENALDLRNRIAHHHPLWDRRPDKRMRETLEVLGWLHPAIATAFCRNTKAYDIIAAGLGPFVPLAESLVSMGGTGV